MQLREAWRGFHHLVVQKENHSDIEELVVKGLYSLWVLVNPSDSNLSSLDARSRSYLESHLSEHDQSGQATPAVLQISEFEQGDQLVLWPSTLRTLRVRAESRAREFAHMRPEARRDRAAIAGRYLAQLRRFEGDDIFLTARSYLIQHAEGVILWVILILSELRLHFERGYHTRQEIQEKLISLPKDLKSVYQQIVATLVKKLDHLQLIEARSMLLWTAFAKRPLKLREFQDAVIISVDSKSVATTSTTALSTVLSDQRVCVQGNDWRPLERKIMHNCGSLVEVIHVNDPSMLHSSVVQLLHQTVKDFLIVNEDITQLRLNEVGDHFFIANALMRYLQGTLPMEELKEKTIPHWREEDYRRFVGYLENRPLLEYAMVYLGQHIEASDDWSMKLKLEAFKKQAITEPDQQVRSLLENRFSTHAEEDEDSKVGEPFRINCMTAAIEGGHIMVVRLLLHTQKDLANMVSLGRKPADIARGCEQKEIVNFLENPWSWGLSWEKLDPWNFQDQGGSSTEDSSI